MSPLPMPVRIAAGLAATAVEQVRELPRLVVEFPVTAVSQALQASMRVQQKVTELAIKGDRALGSLSQAEESPAWATFDDEVDEPLTNGHAAVTPIKPSVLSEPVVQSESAVHPEPEVHPEPDEAGAAASIEAVAEQTLGAEADTPPAVLPGYPGMNLHQLRGKLRTLDLPGLQALLIWETSHENRPPFVTMLSNRITNVQEG